MGEVDFCIYLPKYIVTPGTPLILIIPSAIIVLATVIMSIFMLSVVIAKSLQSSALYKVR